MRRRRKSEFREGVHVLATFDGNHGRKGEIWFGNAICAVCKRSKVCLCVDASEAEYHPGCICEDCIIEHFPGM